VNGVFRNPITMINFNFFLVVIYLCIIFFGSKYVSGFFNKLSRNGQNLLTVRILELITVLLVSLILNYVIIIIPVDIYFADWIKENDFPIERKRLVISVQMIVAVGYYYFVEQIKSKKALAEAELNTQKLQKENTKAQLQTLKNQINPHFLFNSFNILNSLIELEPKRAQLFLEQLSNIYRVFLENINESLIPLKKEIEVMENYSSLLQTRFQNHLNININLDKKDTDWLIPPGVSQMLMENAIKHNGFNKSKPLTIEIYKEGEYLVIKNNKQKRTEPSTSTGIGLRNIKARYELQGNEELLIENTDQFFTVKAPLLKPQAS
jgi:LytS/YehU family sensor histidine kinase